MRAVLDLTRIPQIPTQGTGLAQPACMFPILGKPFIQHVIELVERLGIDEIHLYLYDHAEAIEAFLGDGSRWGVSLSFYLLSRPKDLLKRIQSAPFIEKEELFLFGNALLLPMIKSSAVSSPSLVGFTDHKGTCIQWAVTNKELAARFDLVSSDPVSPMPAVQEVDHISVRSGEEYIRSLRTVLDKDITSLIVIGHEVKNGLWIGPGVRIPKSTTLVPPVYINQKTIIGEDCIVGPYVEIGQGCVIDDESFITESVLLGGSYVGKQLDVKQSIINRNQVCSVKHDTLYTASDEMFLSATASDSGPGSNVPFLSRCIALILLLITSPVQLLVVLVNLLTRRPAIIWKDSVHIPQRVEAGQESRSVRICSYRDRRNPGASLRSHFLFVFLPGLWSVLTGKLRFFGLLPRSREELAAMNSQWREVYLSSNAGVISEAELLYKSSSEEEMLFATDIFYSVHDRFGYNARLALRYVVSLFLPDKRM